MNDQVKKSTNEVTKDIPLSQLDPMIKLEIAREVVQKLSGQFNHWINMQPVERKDHQDDVRSLWRTLELMQTCEFLFEEDAGKTEANAA